MQPTAKRRKEARESGRVVASSQVVGAIVWLAVASGVYAYGSDVLTIVQSQFVAAWSQPQASAGLSDWLRACLTSMSAVLFPVVGLVFVLSVVGRLAQTGFVWAPSRLVPDAERLSPNQRLLSMFSLDKLVDLVRGTFVVASALAMVVGGIWYQREAIMRVLATSDFGEASMQLLASWGLKLGACLAFFAAIDYTLQYVRFERSLQMTPDEMRAEVRAIEGNPAVAARRQRFQQDVASDEADASPGKTKNH